MLIVLEGYSRTKGMPDNDTVYATVSKVGWSIIAQLHQLAKLNNCMVCDDREIMKCAAGLAEHVYIQPLVVYLKKSMQMNALEGATPSEIQQLANTVRLMDLRRFDIIVVTKTDVINWNDSNVCVRHNYIMDAMIEDKEDEVHY